MSAACQPGCGACCDPVTLTYDPATIPEGSPNYAFVREHWTVLTVGDTADGQSWAVHCAAFDRHTRRCTAHDRRPLICAGYPWYGQAPTERRAHNLALVCSYQGEVRTVLPLVAVTHGEAHR